MAFQLKIPEVGESISEVQISEWLKSEGDEVKPDEAVAVIDSEKTTFELPAPKGGRLTKILHQAGDTVKVGAAVAELETNGQSEKADAADEDRKSKSEAKPAETTEAKQTEKPKPEHKAAEKDSDESSAPAESKSSTEKPRRKSTQATSRAESKPERQREAEPETSPDEKSSSTSDARETSEPAGEREEEVVPMTMLRRTVARRLVEAQQTMAMLTTFSEVDMSATQALRKEYGERFEKRYAVKLGLMSFFVKAAVDALKQFPKLNAEIRDQDIVYRNYFDIGVAIATERGLVVPVLRNAERLSFAELEKAIGEFAQRARDTKLKPVDLEGGTFTITNGGVFGSLLSTPIINPPQTGILGMHTIQERPVAIDGQVVVRPMMYLALSYDHRLVDGREAVLFLRRIKEAIENPARLLIEI